MKKIIGYLLATVLLFASVPVSLKGATVRTETTNSTTNAADKARAQVLIDRLYEIRAMDKSKLTAGEKKGIGQEVRLINKQLHSIGNGIYISAGALIVILILVLILL